MSFLQLRSPRIQNKLANPPVVGTAYSMDALAGSYAVSGAAATFLNNRAIAATAGAYTITGVSAATLATRVLPTAIGTYAVSGASALTTAQRVVLANAGATSITGANAFLTRGVSFDATAGTVLITGAPTSLMAARVLVTSSGAYTILGSSADITAGVLPPVVEGGVLQRFDVVYNRGLAIAPSDSVNLDGTSGTSTKPTTADAVYVGASGIVSVVLENGDVVPFTVFAGYVLPIKTIRINSTGTTASQLVALYAV